MYKYKFNIGKEEIDAHVKNSLSEEEREMFKHVKFVPFYVHYNENMDIEITAVGVLDSNTESEDDTESDAATNE